VDRPHLAGPVAEARGAGGEQQRGVVAGAAVPLLADKGAERERLPLWVPLPQPPAGQVEQLRGAVRDGEHAGQLLHDVLVLAVVADRGADPQQAGGVQLQLHLDRQAGLRVRGLDHDPAGAVLPHLLQREQRREVPPGSAAGQSGPAGPARRPLRQQGDPHRVVQRRGGHRRHAGQRQGGGVHVVAEVGAPVQHRRQARTAGVQQQADAAGAQVHEALDGRLRRAHRRRSQRVRGVSRVTGRR
jgi:hypothetical protein